MLVGPPGNYPECLCVKTALGVKCAYLWSDLIPLHANKKTCMGYGQSLNSEMGRRGRDRMVVGFTNTYAISAITTKVVSSNPAHDKVYSIQ